MKRGTVRGAHSPMTTTSSSVPSTLHSPAAIPPLRFAALRLLPVSSLAIFPAISRTSVPSRAASPQELQRSHALQLLAKRKSKSALRKRSAYAENIPRYPNVHPPKPPHSLYDQIMRRASIFCQHSVGTAANESPQSRRPNTKRKRYSSKVFGHHASAHPAYALVSHAITRSSGTEKTNPTSPCPETSNGPARIAS